MKIHNIFLVASFDKLNSTDSDFKRCNGAFGSESTESCILWTNSVPLCWPFFILLWNLEAFFSFIFLRFTFFHRCLLRRPSCSATKSFASWSRRSVRTSSSIRILYWLTWSFRVPHPFTATENNTKNVSPVYWISLLPSNTRYRELSGLVWRDTNGAAKSDIIMYSAECRKLEVISWWRTISSICQNYFSFS